MSRLCLILFSRRIVQTQKELRPGDDLILLTVQQLQAEETDTSRFTAAVLLEGAIRHSPDNAYLKMAAVDVYYQLNAMSRSWEIFQGVGIKHIQLDSCTFPILPFLIDGGMFNETVEICNAMLRFQTSTARDAGDYAGRAMEAGTLSKAHEFLVFQREKMNKSLTVLQAKSLILDAAPLLGFSLDGTEPSKDGKVVLSGGIGIHQGIVGEDDDFERATQMVMEIHNPYAALSVVGWASSGGKVQDCDEMADNRDRSIFGYQQLHKTKIASKDEIARDSLRRGHMHGLLIRASLCVQATKGPKKGKLVKVSTDLEKRTAAFLQSVDSVHRFLNENALSDTAGQQLLLAALELSKVMAGIAAGAPNQSDDSLEKREAYACQLIRDKVLPILDQIQLPKLRLHQVCSMIPGSLLPMFVMFRMTASIVNLFGWGRKKRHTKECAGAMAQVAELLNRTVQELISALQW